ncbi:MAG: hypothetical protein ACE5IO_06340, partial [Thermoplasmata archaeon]
MSDTIKEDSDMTQKPKAGSGDVAHTLVRAGLSTVPIVGGPAAELFSAVIVPPLSKRRDEWIQSIAERLLRLEKKVEGFRLEDLSANDMFVTTVMHATQVAIRNHQEEKLEALRNAVLNAALPNPPEEDLQLMFLAFVDMLTPWHLRLLGFLENPVAWAQEKGIGFRPTSAEGWTELDVFLEDAFPGLGSKRDFYKQLIRDLSSRGLLDMDPELVIVTGKEMWGACVTNMGKEFLK